MSGGLESDNSFRASVYEPCYEGEELLIELTTSTWAKDVDYNMYFGKVPCRKVGYHKYMMKVADIEYVGTSRQSLKVELVKK